MSDSRKKSTRKKQSVTDRNAVHVDMWRYYLMWGFVILCFLALVGRAFYVQIVNHDFLQNKLNANIQRTETVKAMRGVIYDRHGVPLAISTPIMKVVIDPRDYFETKKLYDEITAELRKEKERLEKLEKQKLLEQQKLEQEKLEKQRLEKEKKEKLYRTEQAYSM